MKLLSSLKKYLDSNIDNVFSNDNKTSTLEFEAYCYLSVIKCENNRSKIFGFGPSFFVIAGFIAFSVPKSRRLIKYFILINEKLNLSFN
ncbi:hypothetical protein [Marinagarivorans algicola]|uniref:hypothetical protein n=1 Tax=Marinagarivorans algicola TaxID=1513270 RepID=UPI0006B59740|nr:hypothetical protein [Marinagarivorans algicola]